MYGGIVASLGIKSATPCCFFTVAFSHVIAIIVPIWLCRVLYCMKLQIWTNFRRKSTEGFSPYTTILSLLGGILSVLQMLLLAYNYGEVCNVAYA